MELVSLRSIWHWRWWCVAGGYVRQQLVNFEQPITQEELRAIADKWLKNCAGLSALQIAETKTGAFSDEQRVIDCIIKLMRSE
jgi:hypothetical protein